MADEPLKVEQPLLKSSSEIDKSMTNDKYSPDTKISDGYKFSFSRILSDVIQLTDPRSAKILDKLVEEVILNAVECSILFP